MELRNYDAGELEGLSVWIRCGFQVICAGISTRQINMKFAPYFNSPWINLGIISTLHIRAVLFALQVLYQLKG